jgi:hypothetical protein
MESKPESKELLKTSATFIPVPGLSQKERGLNDELVSAQLLTGRNPPYFPHRKCVKFCSIESSIKQVM